MYLRVTYLLSFLLLLSGCASIVSKNFVESANREVSPALVQAQADEHIGKKVIWGGVIISIKNLQDTTVIEVFQTELSSSDRPTLNVPSGPGARFLIESPGYLDTMIYKKDMGITVGGVIKGIKKKKIGEMEYSYPVVKPIELFLYDFISTADDHYPPPFWGPPYWGPPYMTPAYWDPYWPYYNPYYWPYY